MTNTDNCGKPKIIWYNQDKIIVLTMAYLISTSTNIAYLKQTMWQRLTLPHILLM